ncbi:MAG: zf-HC2 domain-containing protein [Myxococcota bacterium]
MDNYAEMSLDGELDAGERARLEEHLRNCPSCRRRVEVHGWFQSQLRARLREGEGDASPPLGLRTRVTARIREEERRGSSQLRQLMPVTLGLVTLGVLLGSAGAQTSPLDPDVSVARHAARLPPEVRALGDEQPVATFLEQNFPHDVELPQIERALPTSRLMGARLDHVADREAAFIMYDHRGARVSLLVYPSSVKLSPPSAFESRRVGEHDVVVGRHRGYTVLAWTRGPLVYSLVSDVDEHELMRFVSAF